MTADPIEDAVDEVRWAIGAESTGTDSGDDERTRAALAALDAIATDRDEARSRYVRKGDELRAAQSRIESLVGEREELREALERLQADATYGRTAMDNYGKVQSERDAALTALVWVLRQSEKFGLDPNIRLDNIAVHARRVLSSRETTDSPTFSNEGAYAKVREVVDLERDIDQGKPPLHLGDEVHEEGPAV